MSWSLVIAGVFSLMLAIFLCRKKARNIWLWGISALLMPFPTLWILLQLGKAGNFVTKPSVKGWIGRVVGVGIFILCLIYVGDAPLVNNPAACAVKAKIIGFLSPNVLRVDGAILRTMSQSFEILSFAKAGFALAGIGVMLGVCAFRLPVWIILLQSGIGFAIGFFSDVIQSVLIIEIVISGNPVDVELFHKIGFTLCCYILVIVSLLIHLDISRTQDSGPQAVPSPNP